MKWKIDVRRNWCWWWYQLASKSLHSRSNAPCYSPKTVNFIEVLQPSTVHNWGYFLYSKIKFQWVWLNWNRFHILLCILLKIQIGKWLILNIPALMYASIWLIGICLRTFQLSWLIITFYLGKDGSTTQNTVFTIQNTDLRKPYLVGCANWVNFYRSDLIDVTL